MSTVPLPPLPPEDEFDEHGRHVHPYVRDPAPDASAPGYTLTDGRRVTQEYRSRESRLAFHMIEDLLLHLTPYGAATLMQRLSDWLSMKALQDAADAHGVDVEDLDPRGEIIHFAELHATRLAAISAAIEEIVATCPGCGRRHGVDPEDGVAPGAYVHVSSGDAVNVVRVTETMVYALIQTDPSGREREAPYERAAFAAHFVPADNVEVLSGPVR